MPDRESLCAVDGSPPKEPSEAELKKKSAETAKIWFDIAWKSVAAIAALFLFFRFNAAAKELANSNAKIDLLNKLIAYDSQTTPHLTFETKKVGDNPIGSLRQLAFTATATNGGTNPVIIKSVDFRIHSGTLKDDVQKQLESESAEVEGKADASEAVAVCIDLANHSQINWKVVRNSTVKRAFNNKLATGEKHSTNFSIALPDHADDKAWYVVETNLVVEGDANLSYHLLIPRTVGGTAFGCAAPY